jgi:hypothetical protein
MDEEKRLVKGIPCMAILVLIVFLRVGVTTDGVLDCMIGFVYTLYTLLGTTGNIALLLIYTLCNSPSHSSLAISWQRIYNSLTVTSKAYMKSSLHRLIPFLPFLLSHVRLPTPELEPNS